MLPKPLINLINPAAPGFLVKPPAHAYCLAGNQDRSVRYISTRGESPALGFIDVTLAGLARDGGLYVPETWPVLSADAISALAGRPYAEVACAVVRPFVGGTIPDADLARMAYDAYGTFRHPAVSPLTQISPGTFVL